MVDILHKIEAKAAPDAVYQALTARDGLAAWWTNDTQGDGDVAGGVVKFRFEAGGFDMVVLDLQPARRVLWQVVDGPEEWIGTQISWDLAQEGDDHTSVIFKHIGWKEPVDFMHHCSTKWAVYLMSLKSLVETGRGAPAPYDVKIGTWD